MQIIQSNYKNIGAYAEACFRDTPPPCSAACPLGVDVRGLISKVKAGRNSAAFRIYREAVLFPNVVSCLCTAPCSEVCVRAVQAGQNGKPQTDRAVDLSMIERAVCSGKGNQTSPRYAIPQKDEKISIIGAGLSGLACAQRLASKGYSVVLFEAGKKPGGSVRRDLTDAALNEDFATVLGLEYLDLQLGSEIGPDGFDAVASESDAVYICTGSGGESFGLLAGWDARTLATGRKGVFLGGALTCDQDVASSIENGLRAAASIEEYIKTGRCEGGADLFDRKPTSKHYYDLQYAFEDTENSSDSAVDEANRCPECNCSACIDACTMIRWFRQNPKRIAADLEVTLLPVEGKIKHVASRMLNSCNLCGQCGAVCPAHVDTGIAMHESRRLMKQGGNIPAVFHDYWLDDMEFSLSGEAYGLVMPEEATAADVVFFPGCQMAASLPETVVRTFECLRGTNPDSAMMLSCCGVPADWAAEPELLSATIAKIRVDWESIGKPTFLYACATCKKTLEKYLPEAEGRLIYEWLAENAGDLCAEQVDGEVGTFDAHKVTVYDPCAARKDEAGQNAVRTLVDRLGLDIVENSELNGEHAACCGFGGHIYPANPGLLDAILEERREDDPMVTYCANCRDLFLSKGYSATHILERLFGNEDNGIRGRLPSLTERRDNRRKVKAHYFPEMRETISEERFDFSIIISPSLEDKMNRLLLLQKDVYEAVSYCEKSGKKLIDSESGRFIGSYSGKVTTVWVEYEANKSSDPMGKDTNNEADCETFTLFNVYTHRMRVIGQNGNISAGAVDTRYVCAKTGSPLELRETKFSYLDHEFTHKVPWCPSNEMTFISEELATGKISEVETMLEDK